MCVRLFLGNILARSKQSAEPVIIEKTVTKVTKTTRYISNGSELQPVEKPQKLREVTIEASSNKRPSPAHSPHWTTSNSQYEVEVSDSSDFPPVHLVS